MELWDQWKTEKWVWKHPWRERVGTGTANAYVCRWRSIQKWEVFQEWARIQQGRRLLGSLEAETKNKVVGAGVKEELHYLNPDCGNGTWTLFVMYKFKNKSSGKWDIWGMLVKFRGEIEKRTNLGKVWCAGGCFRKGEEQLHRVGLAMWNEWRVIA